MQFLLTQSSPKTINCHITKLDYLILVITCKNVAINHKIIQNITLSKIKINVAI